MKQGSSALRRIKADIRELSIDPSDQYHAAPLEHDMFEWRFTIRGPPDTDFAGGVYHGRILLPPDYPFKPPDIIFLTPSGRFECGVKVCLSFSAHHPELWQPAWGIRLILEALISFLPTPADGALGALDWTPAERRKLARESLKFRCPVVCEEGQTCADLLPPLRATRGGDGDGGGGATKKTMFQKQIEELKMLQFHNHAETDAAPAEQKEPAGVARADATESESTKGAKEERGMEAEGTPNTPSPPPELPREHAPTPAENTAHQTLQTADPPPPDVTPAGAPQPGASANGTATEPGDDVASPPPLPGGGAQLPADAMANTTPANGANGDAPLVSDRLLNMMISFFGLLVLVLLGQAQSLVDELNNSLVE